VRPELLQALVERPARSLQRLEAHRPCDVRGARQPLGIEQRERPERRHHLRAVDQGEPFLCFENDRRQPGARQDVGRRSVRGLARSVPKPGLAFPDHRERDVRERREIARGSDRSARRHARHDAAIEHLAQELDHHGPHARVSEREHLRAQDENAAHLRGRERLADAARVRADEVLLERAHVGCRNARLGQRAKPRIHPIDVGRRIPFLKDVLDDGAAAFDPFSGVVLQLDGAARACDLLEVL
jgi:hypothetical protein